MSRVCQFQGEGGRAQLFQFVTHGTRAFQAGQLTDAPQGTFGEGSSMSPHISCVWLAGTVPIGDVRGCSGPVGPRGCGISSSSPAIQSGSGSSAHRSAPHTEKKCDVPLLNVADSPLLRKEEKCWPRKPFLEALVQLLIIACSHSVVTFFPKMDFIFQN
jgi:hypothetical protein